MRGRKRGSVRLGVERWFERKPSHLRGEVKNHLDRSQFSVLTRTNRPRVWPRRRLAASSAGSCAMGCLGLVRVSNTEEGTSSAFHGLTRKCGAFPRVFSAGRKGFGGLRFCFLHIKQIVASRVRCDLEGQNPGGKKEGSQCRDLRTSRPLAGGCTDVFGRLVLRRNAPPSPS